MTTNPLHKIHDGEVYVPCAILEDKGGFKYAPDGWTIERELAGHYKRYNLIRYVLEKDVERFNKGQILSYNTFAWGFEFGFVDEDELDHLWKKSITSYKDTSRRGYVMEIRNTEWYETNVGNKRR